MRNIIFQLLLVLLATQVQGQGYRWEIIHGVPNRDEVALGVMEDYDKGLYVSGYKWYNYEGDAWSIKMDVNGNLLYDKKLKHEAFTLSTNQAIIDSDGSKYLCGTVQTETNQWPYVSKLDVCGNLVWCKMLDKQNFTHGTADHMVINSNGELIVLLWYEQPSQVYKHFLAGFDLTGEVLWQKPYATKIDYPLLDFRSSRDFIEFNNSYYITGDCYYPFPHDPDHLWIRAMFIGIDSMFNEKFMVPFMYQDSVFAMSHCIIPINDTVLMGAGGRYMPPSLYEVAASLMFITTEGKELGHIEIPNEAIGPDVIEAYPYDIEKINDTLLMTSSYFGNQAGGNPLGEIIMSTSGEVYKLATEHNMDMAVLLKTYDDNFLLAGTKKQNNSVWNDIILRKINADLESVAFDTVHRVYDSLCPHTIQSSTLDLTACLTPVSVSELPTPDVYYESLRWIPVKAYPNPVTHGKVTLEFANTGHHQNMELRCFDNLGRMVHSQKVYKDQQDTGLLVSGWAPGVYLAVVFSNGEARGKVKFIIQ
ncbi:MAG: T9SS type A sorting domain-containing protein [Bacteroidales bacterium]|nr:T9SS type A sorting domain-containing protein [Bacteroidales bacterium]MDD4740494.1 T9SS type A sorting domain-containing protein [Bacteroidales bacterium]